MYHTHSDMRNEAMLYKKKEKKGKRKSNDIIKKKIWNECVCLL